MSARWRDLRRVVLGDWPQVVFTWRALSEFLMLSQLQIQEAAEVRGSQTALSSGAPGSSADLFPRKVGGRGACGVRVHAVPSRSKCVDPQGWGCGVLSTSAEGLRRACAPRAVKETTCTTAHTLRARSTTVQTRALPALTARARVASLALNPRRYANE